MFAQILLISGFVSIGLGLYLLKVKKTRPGKYVWMGQGDDPFKN